MRVLLDECLPRGLRRDLPDHEVETVPEAGWAGQKNGDLLKLACGRFDVILTVDRGIPSQQDLRSLEIAVVAMACRSNRLADLRPLVPEVMKVPARIRPGEVVLVGR